MGNCQKRNTISNLYNRRNKAGQIVYSVPISEPKPGETSIYRLENLIESPQEGMITLQDLYLNSVKEYSKQNFLGVRPLSEKEYKFITYEQSLAYCKEIGSGILNMQLETVSFLIFDKKEKESINFKKDQDYKLQMVGIYAKNCIEWLGIELAGVLYNIQTVPLYDTLGKQGLEFILNETKIETVFCSIECLKLFLKHNLKGSVKRLICFEKLEQNEEETLIMKLKSQNIDLIYFTEIQSKGKNHILDIQKISPDDTYTFSYTSGTTGNPKGALITHRNLLSVIAQGAISESGLCFKGGGTHLSYLPFPHIFEKMYCWLILYHGFTICFYSGNIKLFNEDIGAARPTGMNGVPRIYTRLYDKINDQINKLNWAKRGLAKKAIATKLENLHQNGELTHAIYDRLVFSKCQQVLGGRIGFMLTGSAPLQKEVQDFLKICTSSYMYEGYGGTENSACVSITSRQDKTSGHVGGPTMCNEIKLIDVEEMGYLTKDKMNPKGEICLRGPNIFPGYYRNQELTDEVLEKDGWLHTGDIGELIFDENVCGALRIIDRKKNIFKLAQGEYIASEKIELIYQKVQSVSEIFVYGDSLKTYLVALIYPNFEYLQEQAKVLQVNSNEIDDLIKNQMIKKFVLDEILKQGLRDGLSSLEQVKKIELLPKCFTDYDVLTPAFKLKRFVAKVVFKDLIDELYKE